MRKYEEPEIIVTIFDNEDVLNASSDGIIDDNTDWPF